MFNLDDPIANEDIVMSREEIFWHEPWLKSHMDELTDRQLQLLPTKAHRTPYENAMVTTAMWAQNINNTRKSSEQK